MGANFHRDAFWISFFGMILFSLIAHSGDSHKKKSKPSKTEHPPTSWSYAGAEGPNYWAELDPKFAKCKTGKRQSPINLVWNAPKRGRDIEFYYQNSSIKVLDNGHSIQTNFSPGNYIKIAGRKYELKQLHFHAQSEHTIGNKHFPMEIHFVHEDSQGKLAVLGVMAKVGRKNDSIATIFRNIPYKTQTEAPVKEGFNPIAMIPERRTYYHYMGSLTTPPCTEGVNWNVLNTPLEISRNQLEAFKRFYPNNYRPIKKRNRRGLANYQ